MKSALTPLFFTISDTFLLPCCCNFQTPQKVIDGCHHCIVTESMSLANDQVIEGPTNPKNYEGIKSAIGTQNSIFMHF